MTTTLEMSERQQQVFDLLQQDVSARKIGEQLGISRNAVYQTITRLKKMGALPPDFKQSATPEGTSPGRKLLSELTGGSNNDSDMDVAAPAAGGRPRSQQVQQRSEENTPLSVDLLRELADVQQQLAAMANRLSRYL